MKTPFGKRTLQQQIQKVPDILGATLMPFGMLCTVVPGGPVNARFTSPTLLRLSDSTMDAFTKHFKTLPEIQSLFR
jgi:hypothetical protein